MIFTPEPLEFREYKDLQLAPNESQKDMETAQTAADANLSLSVDFQTQALFWPSSAVFHRFFRDFKRLAYKPLIKFDFLDKWSPGDEDINQRVKVDVLIAAVVAGVALDSLILDLHDTCALKSVLIHLKSELIASTGSLKHFQLVRYGTRDDGDQQFFKTILESANDLRKFEAFMRVYDSTTTPVLRVNGFSRLTALRVQGVIFPVEELVTCLSACRSMLHVHLASVGLSGGETSWPTVYRALASLPRLHQLSFTMLRGRPFKYRRLVFGGLLHGKMTPEKKMIEYEGKIQVTAGLDELARAPVLGEDGFDTSYVLSDRAGGCHICRTE